MEERLHLRHALAHTFLPRKLPQANEQIEIVEKYEGYLLKYMSNQISETNRKYASFLQRTSHCFQQWVKLQSKCVHTSTEEAFDFHKVLKDLQVGQSVSLYIRSQNCTMLLTKLDDSWMRVITFRASLPAIDVISTVGSLRVTYPESINVIPISKLLLSPSFTKQIRNICLKTVENIEEQPKVKDVPSPGVVSEYLVGMLSPMSPEEYTESIKMRTENIQIKKKVRDEVAWNGGTIPFRRSGLWMSTKVILQLMINEEVQNKEGALLAYKTLVLNMLAFLCKEHYNKCKPTNTDFTMQMLVKLARRAAKISLLPPASHKFSVINDFKNATLDQVNQLIGTIHGGISDQWLKCDRLSRQPIKMVTRKDQLFLEDRLHNIENLSEYIMSRQGPQTTSGVDGLAEIDKVERCSTLSEIISKDKDSVWIYDVERFVLLHLDSEVHSYKEIFQLLLAYTEKVVKLYAEQYKDPVSFSRMTLTVLKIIQVLDKIAVDKHPLLKEYNSGIKLEAFDNLLLFERQEMEKLEEILNYFRARNEAATGPSLIESKNPSKSCFPVCYAMQCESMQALRKRILNERDKAVDLKKEEVDEAKKECSKLEREMRWLHCKNSVECYIKRDCKHCDLTRQLNATKSSVKIYQEPLPTTEYLQYAVVFELQIPDEVACLRDALSLFVGEICSEQLFDGLTTSSIRYSHTNFVDLNGVLNKLNVNLGNSGTSAGLVDFGTVKKSASQCAKTLFPDVRYAEFILDNALTYNYYMRSRLRFNRTASVCTFQIKMTSGSAPYENLQFSLNSTKHTDNFVIALQATCHSELTLKEFIAFGSIRAGHRIQLRNLYAAISGKTISLEEEPVVALVMQALGEVGPGIWESHEDSCGEAFSMEFLTLVRSTMELNAKSWSRPLIMLPLVVISVRILEVCQTYSVRTTCREILRRCRELIEEWSSEIEGLLSKREDDGGDEEKQHLLGILLQANLCSAYSFNVSSLDVLQHVISDTMDVLRWLQMVTRMHHLVKREKSDKTFSPFLTNLLRRANLDIPLNIEDVLHQKIEQTPEILYDFICERWTTAKQFPGSGGSRCPPPKAHIYEYQFRGGCGLIDHLVHIDILHGTFLVDGYPPSYLPDSFTSHPLFQRVFSSSHFKVQRDSCAIFRTVDAQGGHHYEFFMTDEEEKNQIIIRQLHDNYFMELLPPELFENHIGAYFINNYTHWLHSTTNEIHFRLRSNNTQKDTSVISYKMLFLNQPGSPLVFKSDQNEILSINSPGFKEIVGILRKLEVEEFIDVYIETGNNASFTVSANLRRMGLQFILKNGLLYSCNYPGYSISPLQTMGTLVGLEGGILLNYGEQRIFVVNHREIKINSGNQIGHQSVSFTQTPLRHPQFFVYEIDPILQRLKASNDKSAWLYLALLHAATSSPLPDPFTGVTGVEMAMWILQSEFVFSSCPYDQESMKTLGMIGNLAPRREYHPPHLEVMERTTWPAGLENNTFLAYDGFGIVVQKLVQDSLRLSGLFPGKSGDSQTFNEAKISVKLREKAYFRHINVYNPAAHVRNMPRFYSPDKHPPKDLKWSTNEDLLKFARIRMKGKPVAPKDPQCLSKLILTDEKLPGIPSWTFKTAHDWLQKSIRNQWLALFVTAKNNIMDKDEFTLILGAILYSGNGSLDNALALHNVACFSNSLAFPPLIKPVDNYDHFVPAYHKYEKRKMEEILKSVSIPFGKSVSDFITHSTWLTAKTLYDQKVTEDIVAAEKQICSSWPKQSLTRFEMRNIIDGKKLKFEKAFERINVKFTFWYNNYLFKGFLDNVEEVLRTGYAHIEPEVESKVISCAISPHRLHYSSVRDIADSLETDVLKISFPKLSNTKEFLEAFQKASKIFETGEIPEYIRWNDPANKQREQVKAVIEKFSELLNGLVTSGEAAQRLDKAGIVSRRAPVVFLRNLLHLGSLVNVSGPLLYIYNYTGALAVLFCHLKRLDRILKFKENPAKYSVELSREEETKGFDNWSPKEHPEWLLLQLELDLTIRPVQVRVAKHMMTMSGEGDNSLRNGVMQLNMGEGKTSVIVPMVVSALSTTQMMCRVTVLSSIFETNYDLLTFTIGGFLGRRVYTVPCRRDLETLPDYLDEVQRIYKECLLVKGVLLTLPEYRLSFRLMIYNHFGQDKHTSGLKFHQIENWLREHVRDIVDESDEVFSVKYQLIYTVGQQENIKGGCLRWNVCQKILQLLPTIASKLFEKYGENVIEFSKELAKDYPDQFTHFRIVSDECRQDLYGWVADAVLDGRANLLKMILNEKERAVVKEFLTNETIEEERHNEALKMFYGNEEATSVILLLSGYLRRGILFAALSKRWRVDCGVGVNKKIAVPFRAKDVAAERTEFGHPDIAIILSQLSYYYSGLNDKQLFECFNVLERMSGGEKVYTRWIEMIPEWKGVHSSIKTYKGINLKDYKQRTEHLFPMLRKHRAVVDFWLENIVFPNEAKQFPRNIVTNAWDLCYEKCRYPTTGFSGTNDTSLLLPATISQQDLEELKKTNEEVEATLKQPENVYKRSLPMGVGCKQILEGVKEDGSHVLVDAGALMLELDNEQVAQLWLSVDETCEGVVYFSKDNKLLVKARGAVKDTPLKLSSYVDRMDSCRIYLDDQHCRGTDLKLPNTFKACVTVGSGMRRDKLIQACMRMRKLGKGQSVQFYLSHEVHNKILGMKVDNKEVITTEDILAWVSGNSKNFEKDGLLYWTLSAVNYAQKLGADEIFMVSDKSDTNNSKTLAEQCEDEEVLCLHKMYGKYRQQERIIDLIPKWFLQVKQKLQKGGIVFLPGTVVKAIKDIQKLVEVRCRDNIPTKTYFSCVLDEEQEKELEVEHEEETKIERPPPADPCKPGLHENVTDFIKNGGNLVSKQGIVILADIFQRTSFWPSVQPHCWSPNAFASVDFTSVVQTTGKDSFLRPMSYFASWTPPTTDEWNGVGAITLLLSQYEVNELMPHFRGQPAVTLHMFSGRTVSGQDILVNKESLQLPLLRSGGVHLGEKEICPLLIASGNLYYASIREQEAFASFLGLALRPWGTQAEEAFTQGIITKTGFVMPNQLYQNLRGSSLFKLDPTDMVKAILRCRHEVVREVDQVIQILDQCRFIEMEDSNDKPNTEVMRNDKEAMDETPACQDNDGDVTMEEVNSDIATVE